MYFKCSFMYAFVLLKSTISEKSLDEEIHFGVETSEIAVFDAGSSGTRLSVYKYSNKSKNIISETVYEEISIDKNKKPQGIHEYYDNDHRIKEMIMGLIYRAKLGKDTIIGFYCTAGVRSLEVDQQDMLKKSIRKALSGYNLKEEVTVISGKMEGVLIGEAFEFCLESKLKPMDLIIDNGGMSTQLIYRDYNSDIDAISLEVGLRHYNNDDISEFEKAKSEAFKNLDIRTFKEKKNIYISGIISKNYGDDDSYVNYIKFKKECTMEEKKNIPIKHDRKSFILDILGSVFCTEEEMDELKIRSTEFRNGKNPSWALGASLRLWSNEYPTGLNTQESSSCKQERVRRIRRQEIVVSN